MSSIREDQETSSLSLGGVSTPSAQFDAGLVLIHPFDPSVVALATPITAEGVVIGREPPPRGLCLPLGSISRVHARIGWTGNAFLLADMNSRNGVFVNGQRIRGETVIGDGDLVGLGEALFKFVTSSARAHASARSHAEPALRGAAGGLSMRRLAAEVEAVARTSLSILISGESGVGKEVVAVAVHEASGRRGRLCVTNCAAIPVNLLESELFGHVKGAFTGAERERVGLFRRAHQGTVFLDEVADLAKDAQAKLLRVLETKEVLPLGADECFRIDVRILCATHRDLRAEVERGAFRGDLLARIAGATIYVPPLRARKEDLPILVNHLALEICGTTPTVTSEFMTGLALYDWPYNVRELRSVVERALALAKGAPLSREHLPKEVLGSTPLPPMERRHSSHKLPEGQSPNATEIRALLERHRGNVSAMARELERDRALVHRWVRRYGFDPESFRR